MTKIDRYKAYLESWNKQHPNIVEPNSYEKPNLTNATVIDRNCKFWSSFGYVYKLENGGICEATNNNAGCQVYATWDKEEDYKNYSSPMCANVFYEQW